MGETFAIPAQSVQLIDAAGTRILGLADTVARPTVSVERPGVYQLRTPSRSRPLAVNTDSRESDLRRTSGELLTRWKNATAHTDPSLDSSKAREQIPDTTHDLPLAPWLLALLAMLVFAEPLFANSGPINKLRSNRPSGEPLGV